MACHASETKSRPTNFLPRGLKWHSRVAASIITAACWQQLLFFNAVYVFIPGMAYIFTTTTTIHFKWEQGVSSVIFFLNQNIASITIFFSQHKERGSFLWYVLLFLMKLAASHISTSTLPVFSMAFFHQEDSKAEGDATFVMGAA